MDSPTARPLDSLTHAISKRKSLASTKSAPLVKSKSYNSLGRTRQQSNPVKPSVALVEDDDALGPASSPHAAAAPAPAPPPTLFQYAMSIGMDPAVLTVPVTSLPRYERMYGNLCDYGDPQASIKDAVQTTLFSFDAFWEHVEAKHYANYMYITDVTKMFKWTAAVCLEYFSHKFVPVERELCALRVSLEGARQAARDADRRAEVEMEQAKGFRGEKAEMEKLVVWWRRECEEVRARADAIVETVKLDCAVAVQEVRDEIDAAKEQTAVARRLQLQAEAKYEDVVSAMEDMREKFEALLKEERESRAEAWRGRAIAIEELKLAVKSARLHQEERFKTLEERDVARQSSQEYLRMLRHARQQLELAGQNRRKDYASAQRAAAAAAAKAKAVAAAAIPSAAAHTHTAAASDSKLGEYVSVDGGGGTAVGSGSVADTFVRGEESIWSRDGGSALTLPEMGSLDSDVMAQPSVIDPPLLPQAQLPVQLQQQQQQRCVELEVQLDKQRYELASAAEALWKCRRHNVQLKEKLEGYRAKMARLQRTQGNQQAPELEPEAEDGR